MKMRSTVYCVIYSAYIIGHGQNFSRPKKKTEHNFWVMEVKILLTFSIEKLIFGNNV